MERSHSRDGFSIASVFLSYLMIAGGIAAGLLALTQLGVEASSPQLLLAGAFGAGALVGGFFAARASRGSTVAEPAIGAVLVVATLCGVLLATPIGRMFWRLAQEELTRTALILGGAALAGALVGAFVSEKAFGSSTRWSLPWVLYVALAVAGGCFLAALAAGAVRFATFEPETVGGQFESDKAMQVTVMAGIAGGCFLAGLCAGASSRTRILIASFLGAGLGVFGFFLLVGRFSRAELDQEALIAAAVVAAGGGVITLLSTALGWAAVGKRRAA
jgi:hypothetical protein